MIGMLIWVSMLINIRETFDRYGYSGSYVYQELQSI